MTSLSLDQEQDTDQEYNDLDERILSIVSKCKNHEIRPAKLAAELGMSVDDACAQLCGLLAAVGEGSSFVFDEQVMVFNFPPDFAKRARRFQQRQSCRENMWKFLLVSVKLIKVITAFGLILSLLIVSIAAMVGLIAAIVAMSRSGNQHGGAHHRAALVQRLRGMFYTTRQLLWCYAMFGNNVMPGQDPFLQEIVYDLALFSSMCCGNPGSLFFWMRASQRLRQRRQRRNGQRGWLRNRTNTAHDLEGVALVQRGTWGQGDQDNDVEPSQEEPFRGLLSISVEFLFGPTPFVPGPTESEKYKLRAAVILQYCDKAGQGISLQELSPYIDFPPASLKQETAVCSEGLAICSHFNGKPAPQTTNVSPQPPSKARFVFPELSAESATVIQYQEPVDDDDGSWEFLFHAGNDAPQVSSQTTTSGGGRTTGSSNIQVPSSLQESRYVLTRLEKKQFHKSVVLGILNFIGVYWLQQSLEPNGVLDLQAMAGTFAAAFLQKGLVPLLRFYSILFFILPLARLILILWFNAIRTRRNRRRADFAYALSQSSVSS